MQRIWEFYKYFSDKRYSTIAGTLVYFLLMSVAPFLFWLTLLAGRVDFSRFVSDGMFTAISPVVNYLQAAAESATAGAGIIFLVTSLWSSTNFFYHLRRSGEIIYGQKINGNGIRIRLSAVAVVLVTVIFIALAAAVPFFSYNLLEIIMPPQVAEAISLIFVTMFALFAAYFLNCFACPYKVGFDNAMPGSLLTVTLWLICSVGFKIYLSFANPQKLYGAIAAIIVFLLWCYVMITSLVIGIIYNGMSYGKATERKVKAQSVFDNAAQSQRPGTDMHGNA